MYLTTHQNRLLTPPPSLVGAELRKLQTRSAQDARVLHRLAEDKGSSFSLRELVNSMMPTPLFAIDHRAVDVAREFNETAKSQSGHTAWGTWVPFSALAKRDLTAAGASSLVAPGVDGSLQSALAPHSAVMAGATILTGLNGNAFSLPTIDVPADAESAWIGEGNTGPSLTPSTRLATLTPKTLIFQVLVSRRLMQQTSIDLERVLRAELLRNTMQAIDEAALRGAGPDAPAGLLNDAALQVNSAGANGLAPAWSHLVELEYQVGLRAGEMVAPAFLTSPSIRKKLRTTPRGAGLDYILADTASTVMGQPLRVSSMVPDNLDKGTSAGVCSAAVFGDWSECFIGFWGPAGVDVQVDPNTAASTGMIKLTVRAEVGVATRDIKAFSAYKDLLGA